VIDKIIAYDDSIRFRPLEAIRSSFCRINLQAVKPYYSWTCTCFVTLFKTQKII